jgi:hypothetical protein
VTAGERLYVELGEPSRQPWARLPGRLTAHFERIAEAVRGHEPGPTADPRLPGYAVVSSDRARTIFERRTA